jgi:hypothetical protein
MKINVWNCTVGSAKKAPENLSTHLRKAIITSCMKLEKKTPEFIFSDWRYNLTYAEKYDKANKVWDCKLGWSNPTPYQTLDYYLRQTVEYIYFAIVGSSPKFVSSGWDGKLSFLERSWVDMLLRK